MHLAKWTAPFVLAACGFPAFGGTTHAVFAEPARWKRYTLPEAPRVSLDLPGPGAASDCAGDGDSRRVCVHVQRSSAALGFLTRADLLAACTPPNAVAIAWRVVDGHDVCLSEALDLSSGGVVVVPHGRRSSPPTFEPTPLLRTAKAVVLVDGTLVTVVYEAPDATWSADAHLRDALFGSLRISL